MTQSLKHGPAAGPHARLDRVAAVLAAPAELAGRIGGWLLPLLAAVIVYDVVGRKFFNTGSSVLQELEWHLHGAALLLAFGFCYLRDAHVRIDLIRGLMSERARLRLEIVGVALFLLPYMLLLAWYGYEFAARAFVRGEGSTGGVGLPMRWIIKSFVPLGAVLMLLAGSAVLLRCLARLRSGGAMQSVFPAEETSNPVTEART